MPTQLLTIIAVLALAIDGSAAPPPPTAVPVLQVPETAGDVLANFAKVPKFGPDKAGYTGIRDPLVRARAEAIVNRTIAQIASGIKAHPTKVFVLDAFKSAMDELNKAGVSDTEDRIAVANCFEHVMDVVGLPSSDGLLNNYVYGFDPTTLSPN